MKTTRRDLLESIRNPAGLSATIRGLDTRIQRVERAPVKFDFNKPNPPKKAPVAVGKVTQPVTLAAVLNFAAWSGSDPETMLSSPFVLINEENDDDYDVITTASAAETILESVALVDVGKGHYAGDPDPATSWTFALTPTVAGSTVFIAVQTQNDGGGSHWDSGPSISDDLGTPITWSTLVEVQGYGVSPQQRLTIFQGISTAESVSGGATITVDYASSSDGGSCAVAVEYTGSQVPAAPVIDQVSAALHDTSNPYELTVTYPDHPVTWTMDNIGDAGFMIGISVGLK